MQRISQRRNKNAKKDDNKVSPMVASRITNMAKELENVLRSKPNTNDNKTETVVVVNEDVIKTIESKDASQKTKRKKTKQNFNIDEE